MSTAKKTPAEKATTPARKTATRSYEPDWVGRLATQSGPRTTAPMWARPLLTPGEWAVYTALWSFGDWDGSSAFPTHQKLADRAFVERSTVAAAVLKFESLGLFKVERAEKGESDRRNRYVLLDVPTAKLIVAMRAKLAEREQAQILARAKRRQGKESATRKGKKAAPPAETSNEGGTTLIAPPVDEGGTTPIAPPGTTPIAPPGTTPIAPITYPGFDLVQVTNPPPAQLTPGDTAPAAVEVEAATGGDSSSTEEQPKSSALDGIVVALVDASGGVWSSGATRDVLEALVRAGRAPADVVRIATEVAQGKHGVTQSPRRLLSWWPSGKTAAAAGAEVVEPDWARGPFTYLERDRERCRTHPSEPAGTCGRCKADKVAVDADEPVTMFELPEDLACLSPLAAAKAMAARAKTSRAGHKQRSPEPVDEPTGPPPAAAGSLFGAIAAQVGGTR